MAVCMVARLKKMCTDGFECEAFVAVKGDVSIAKLVVGIKRFCQYYEEPVYFGEDKSLEDFKDSDFIYKVINEEAFNVLKSIWQPDGDSNIIYFGTGYQVFETILGEGL